jgi:hypothetical protein
MHKVGIRSAHLCVVLLLLLHRDCMFSLFRQWPMNNARSHALPIFIDRKTSLVF